MRKLESKRNGIYLSSKMFSKAIDACCSQTHSTCESCVYRDFSRCVKKLLGKMALNGVQRSFDLITKIRTPEIIILCAFFSFQERSQNPLNAPGFVALRTLWIQKRKVDAIKTRLQSNR